MQETEAERRAALAAAVEAFGAAWARGDMETLRALLSPSYTHNDAFGAHHGYESWLAYASRRTGRQTRITFREVETRLFGDVAVITGFNDLTGGGATGPEDGKDLTLAFTQVWRWQDGRWLREAFQATPVAASR